MSDYLLVGESLATLVDLIGEPTLDTRFLDSYP
jgi:hypothetical protein